MQCSEPRPMGAAAHDDSEVGAEVRSTGELPDVRRGAADIRFPVPALPQGFGQAVRRLPNALERTLAMPRTWLLSGIPRSGTSLCCRLAGGLPDTVALSEPLNGEEHREPSRDPRGAPAYIGRFVEHARERLLRDRRAPTMLVGGRLDDQMVAPEPAEAGLRQPHARWGEMVIEKRLSARFTLVVKHNALFTALLPRLASSFPCLGLVRNPLAALASWQTVNLPIHRGRIPEGEALDPGLHRALEHDPDVLRRQILVLNWFMARFRHHLPPENVIRYEDLVASGGRVLFRRLGHAHVPPVTLGNRNDNPVYDRDTIDTLLDALLSAGGDWTHFYGAADCERLADRILAGGPDLGEPEGRGVSPRPRRGRIRLPEATGPAR